MRSSPQSSFAPTCVPARAIAGPGREPVCGLSLDRDTAAPR